MIDTAARRIMNETLRTISTTGTAISMRSAGNMCIFTVMGKNFYIEAVKDTDSTNDTLSMSLGRRPVFVLNDVLSTRCIRSMVRRIEALYKLQQSPVHSFEMGDCVRQMKDLYDQSISAKDAVLNARDGKVK